MSSEIDTIHLRYAVQGAAESLRAAATLAGEFPGWPAMAELRDTLADLADQADLALTPELRKIADDADAYLDRMADLSAADTF